MMRRAQSWVVVTVVAVLGLVGCGGSNKSSNGSANHRLGDAAIQSVDVVARAGQPGTTFQRPLDAAPSPDGKVFYFVATGDSGPAVFRVPAAGGAVAVLASGGALAKPTGLAVATDSRHVYIADQQAAASGMTGAILAVPTTEGTQVPDVIPGTEGRSPRGLYVVDGGLGNADLIYFTGVDPGTAQPGLFEVSSAGGTVTTVAEGQPFDAPDSVVVNAQGVAFVSDHGVGSQLGMVLRVSGGTVSTVLTGLDLGAPAGVALADSGATLLVSSMNSTTQADQLLFDELATGKTAVATKVIGANVGSSGGVHLAYQAPVAAWADTQGTVYRVRFPVGA